MSDRIKLYGPVGSLKGVKFFAELPDGTRVGCEIALADALSLSDEELYAAAAQAMAKRYNPDARVGSFVIPDKGD